jgi:Skp family chaperone for outer membrane proteins
MLCAVLVMLHLAAAPPDAPIGVVNAVRLMAESIDGKAATARIEALRKEREKAIADKQAAIQTLTEKRAAVADIEKARRELQRTAEDAQADVEALDQSERDEFFKKVQPVLKQIGEEDHFGIILQYPNPLLSWVKPSVDVTSKVIERLDSAKNKK